MLDPLGNWCPNWERILSSNVWHEDILPWLKDMESEIVKTFDALDSLEALRVAQGQLRVLKDLREMPQGMIDMEKLEKEREVEDAGRRRSSFGFGRGRR